MPEQTNSNVPKIRFKGFEGDWDMRILGDEPGEIIAGGDVEKHKLCERGKYPVLANALQNHGILGFYKDDFRVKAPAVTVTGRGDVGHATVRETDFTPVVRLLSVKSTHNVYFLKESINNHKVLVESTGVPQLTVPQLSKYRICFPGTIREENQIGEYFIELDRLIGLHQRKHDKLVTLKKAMLQKMFPQPGATTPEIRFKGFSGDWVEKEFKLIASRSSQSCSEKELPRIEYEDIVSGAGRLNKNLFKKISQKAGVKFAKGDVLFGKLRPYLRNWWLAEFEGIAVGDFWVLTSAAAIPIFLYSLIQTEAFERIANLSAGSKMPRSDWKLVSNSLFRAPPDPIEQQKIGTYFRTLDELISQHATQLQKLNQIKSACLEKMFV